MLLERFSLNFEVNYYALIAILIKLKAYSISKVKLDKINNPGNLIIYI